MPEHQSIQPPERIPKRELGRNEQSRIQGAYNYTINVLGRGDTSFPLMAYSTPNIPTRISDCSDYLTRLRKDAEYGKLCDTVEAQYKGSPLHIRLDNGVEIEPLQNINDAVTTVVGDSPITIAYSSDIDAKNVRMSVDALNKAAETAAAFGVNGIADENILVFNSQLSMFASHHDPVAAVTIIGTRGITHFDQTELLAVAAHEGTHPRFGFTMGREFGIDVRERIYYSMAGLIEFLDEGTAVVAQQAGLGIPARKILKDNFDAMHPKAKDALRNGRYSPDAVNSVQVETEKEEDPIFVGNVHSRSLPGAFVEYCVSKGIKVQDLIGVVTNKFSQSKSDIARTLGIEEDDVSLNWQRMLLKMKEKRGESITDEEERGLEVKVWEVADEFDMRPFQVLAAVEGSSDEAKTTQHFLEWAELKAA